MPPTKGALFSYLAGRVPVTSSYFGSLVADGDSLTFGAGVPTAYPPQLTLSGGLWVITNKGVNGQLLSAMVANAATDIDPLYNATVKNVVILWGGINDLASSVTPATCYANYKAFCDARHAIGWKVVVTTLPSNKFVDNTREQFNTLLRADHSFADAIADFIGTPINVDGGWSNLSWFQSDGIHPNESGIQTYELPVFNAAVNSLF